MIYMSVGQYCLIPTKDIYNLGGPLSVFRFPHLFTCILDYFGGTLSVSGFLIHLQLFGVSVLGRPSPMLEGIGFGWAPIGFAVKSLLKNE